MKVFFETFGCTSNQADTEIMRGIVGGNHNIVSTLEDSDVVVINSCGVIERTQRKVIKKIKESKVIGKKVILAGCLPKIEPESILEYRPDSTVPPASINQINQAVEAAFKGLSFNPSYQVLDKASLVEPNGGPIAKIPISEGCLGSCSYCATRFARGKLRSFRIESIIKAVEEAVADGCREIQLTAQDTGIYGMDRGRALTELLAEICGVEGDFRVRVGMMNPSSAIYNTSDLIDAFKNKKIYKFLHLPLQSGDNKILRHMRRGYLAEDYLRATRRFRKEIPDLTLSTDVIIGYPNEDEESFKKTLRFIGTIKPNILNITRFSPRPNTRAANLKDMPDRIKKERSRNVSLLAKRISKRLNKNYLGTWQEVLITEQGKNGTLLGRTRSYKQVVLRLGRIGEFKKVKITDAKENYLIA
jgi:MiaB-like tRNA modifying enzyme